jgi:hypothetical protein
MPYIAPKPREQAKTTSPTPEFEADAPSSSITPAFISSTFDTTAKSDIYSPSTQLDLSAAADSTLSPTLPATSDIVSQPNISDLGTSSAASSHSLLSLGKTLDVKSSQPSPTFPDTSDVISQQGLSRASTTSNAPTVVSKRSSWSHRKPVPSVIVLPTTSIPSSHPFARDAPSPRSRGDLGSPPVSPRLSGPVPPRRAGAHNRSISNLASPASPAGSEMSEGSGILWRPPVPEVARGNGDEVEELRSDFTETSELSTSTSRGQTTRQQRTIPSRHSSRQSTPTPSQATQLAAPVSVDHHTTSSTTTHESEQRTPPILSPGHPLRLRLDKSLPALPLDADSQSLSPLRTSRHKATTSTSSGPSTQIVTPRSNSHGFAQTENKAADQEKRKVRWPKSLIELSRSLKDKSTNSFEGEKTATSAEADSGEDESFSVDRIPSKRRLFEAGTLFLRDENGDLVCFGDMFPKTPLPVEDGEPVPPVPRTVIFFIRHFWCGQCQDFMFASLSQLDPVAVEKAGIKVIVISNGSWKIIKSYKKLFKCPFPIYVDGPRKLYSLLGYVSITPLRCRDRTDLIG